MFGYADTDLSGLGSRVPASKHSIAAFLEQKAVPYHPEKFKNPVKGLQQVQSPVFCRP